MAAPPHDPQNSLDGLDPAGLLELARQPFEDVGPASDPADSQVLSVDELAEYFPDLEIIECIGRGGMGHVYKARQKQLDRHVALKILPRELGSDAKFAERFTREARALAQLNHPNIVTIHDFGHKRDVYYLVMEYMDGMNLRELLNAHRLSSSEVLEIVPKLCNALQYAHRAGIVHRDIKPENILFDRHGHAKIADFGLAKLVIQGLHDPTLTGSRQAMGTPYYMAPEQWQTPNIVDHRVDLYALGVVLYEMLTGQLPLGRFDLPSKKSGVDHRFDRIVMRSLQQEPAKRYQSASELEQDVQQIAKGKDLAAHWLPFPQVPDELPDPREMLERAAHSARSHIVPRIAAVFKKTGEFILALPLPTVAACGLIAGISMNNWLMGTYTVEMPPNERYHTYAYRGHDVVSVETRQAPAAENAGRAGERPEPREIHTVRGGFSAYDSAMVLGNIQVENMWPAIAAGAIAVVALLRPFLKIKADLTILLLCSYGIAHITAFYNGSSFRSAYGVELDDIQLTATPGVIAIVFGFLFIGTVWNILLRITRAMQGQHGPRAFCRSIYRVWMEETRLF